MPSRRIIRSSLGKYHERCFNNPLAIREEVIVAGIKI